MSPGHLLPVVLYANPPPTMTPFPEEMYPTFAKEAEEEGNTEAAKLFTEIAKVEKEHEDRYKKLLKLVQILVKNTLK